MVKLLVWLAGCFLLIFAINHFALWRVVEGDALALVAAFWIVGGAVLLGGKGRAHRSPASIPPADAAALIAAARKAAAEQHEKAQTK